MSSQDPKVSDKFSQQLGKDETVIAHEAFAPNLVLFWLKSRISVTEKRVSGTVPNTFLGLIPVGSRDILFPLKQVSSMTVNTRVKPVRIAIGILITLASLGGLGSAPAGALLGLLFGVALVLTGLTCALTITNNAGAQQHIDAILFDQERLKAFSQRASAHLLDL